MSVAVRGGVAGSVRAVVRAAIAVRRGVARLPVRGVRGRRVPVGLLAVSVDRADTGGGAGGIPVVTGVAACMISNDVAVPTPVLDDAVVALIVDVDNLAGNVMVIGDFIAVTVTTDIV